MRLATTIALLLSTPALAQAPQALPCIDASSRNTYNAKPVSRHEVLARSAIGKDERTLRLGTTCIHIDRTATISLRSLNQCIAKGDEVTTVAVDGQGEICRVSGATLGGDYSLTKYK